MLEKIDEEQQILSTEPLGPNDFKKLKGGKGPQPQKLPNRKLGLCKPKRLLNQGKGGTSSKTLGSAPPSVKAFYSSF